MKASDFVHLHCHSTYSLLEALPRPEEIIERTKELGQTAVGLADKGYTYGLIEFYKVAKEHDIKPILGCEVYVAARTRHDKERADTTRYPLTLLCENQQGYKNLLELCSKAALEGMYYKPRVDDELLQEYGKGLIALSGPLGGTLPQAALAEDGDRIKELLESYHDYFGKENVYFELMDLPNVAGQAEINQQLIHWGKELDVPVVATCNSHYCRPDDAGAHDVLLCIQKNANVHDQSRFSMIDSDFSMRPFEEMEKVFSHTPEALSNTRIIADRCNIDFEFGKYQIPVFEVPKGETEASTLKKMCLEGVKKRYKGLDGEEGGEGKGNSGVMVSLPNHDASSSVALRQAPSYAPLRWARQYDTSEVMERLEYELKIIEQMGFSGYFLIVADFVQEAKKRGITVGPGRGSAAGSIVSYCLDITTLDPLEHGLLFERFLNPERVSMPDIDLDFADTRRDEVLQYVAEKYGRDHVVQICTFGTLAARAAVKDVGRAYGVPFVEMNELAKLIPMRPGTLLKDALEESAELKAAYNGNEIYKRIIDTALKLEGKARHVSVHACGVIITDQPTVQYTALQRAPKDDKTIITQYSAKPLEALGLLKMDFLGLKNLSIIQTTLEIIERLHGEKINIESIPIDDPDTYALLARAETMGVFQLESGGMRRYLKQLKPTEFEDITAMVSLFRPGPMDWIPDYIARKHGRKKVKYLHDDLKQILEPTYGIGIYQEQILEIARVFAGYTLGEADLLRRAIGKKIKSELNAQRKKFIGGAVEKGYQEKLAVKIFDDVITPFAGYGFNKSHGACYARIAYETAYLKARYPTEFMSALLSADADDTDRVALEIAECRNMGMEVLPPDINESLSLFTALLDKKIRFGLAAIKGVGESSVGKIIEEREKDGRFETIEDLAKRIPSKALNKKLIESLAKAGALDSLGDRSTFIEHYEKIVDFSKAAGDVGAAQTDMFTIVEDGGSATIDFPETREVSHVQRLQWEKEALGLYVSSHPLAGLKQYIAKKAMLVESFDRKMKGKKVTVAGIVEGVKKITTKKGDTMAIVFLEDPTGKIEITLFPKTYANAAGYLEEPDTVLVTGGRLDERAGQMQIRADATKRASLTGMIHRAKKEGMFDEEEAKRGIVVKNIILDDVDESEMVDEEGNIVAGETITVGTAEKGNASEFVGDLVGFISRGMIVEEALKELRGVFDGDATKGVKALSNSPHVPDGIHVHTIELPEKAPRQLLLDLKEVLERYPGKERIQLKIGSRKKPLPLSVTMSTILEKKISEVLERYKVKE